MKISEVIGDYRMSGSRRMQAPGNLRVGRQTMGSRGSLASDVSHEEDVARQDMNALQKAAVVYVTKDGKVLSVTRGSDINDKNMPGGGVELGEEPIDAAVREMREETGLQAEELFPVYSKVCEGKLVTVYRVTKYSGKLRSSDEGVAAWVDPSEILSGSRSDFFQDMIVSLYRSRRVS